MSESIFEFGDKFGIESPFGNWLTPNISFNDITFEWIEKENIDKTITHSMKIRFSIYSDITDSNAKTTLLTRETATTQLKLPSGGKLTPLNMGKNNFEIVLNKTAYDKHQKNVGNSSLYFYFSVSMGNLNKTSDDFRIQSFLFKTNNVKQDETYKLIEFNINSIGILNENMTIQAYQKVENGYVAIDNLMKTIKLANADYTDTFKITRSTVSSRLTSNNSATYMLQASSAKSTVRSGDLDLTIENTTQKLTSEQIKNIIPTATLADIETFINGINQALKDNNISSSLQVAHFLAQIFHESGNLHYTKEIGATETTYPGGFYGRGLIQITGETNYKAYGKFCGEDVTSTLKNRNKLAEPYHAARSAGWWWGKDTYNQLAEKNDIIMITRKINGGLNGYDDRLKLLLKAYSILSDESGIEIKFIDSAAYNDNRASFSWGAWHDPGITEGQFATCSSNKERAIEGYERFLLLNKNKTDDQNWYGIQSLAVFSSIKIANGYDKQGNKKYKVIVRKAAELRLKELKK